MTVHDAFIINNSDELLLKNLYMVHIYGTRHILIDTFKRAMEFGVYDVEGVELSTVVNKLEIRLEAVELNEGEILRSLNSLKRHD